MSRAEEIVAAARGWIGTPYRHRGSLKGAGCDCLGLVRGVWREVVGPEPEPLPPYGADWAETGERETLLDAAERWLAPVERWGTGDVLLFRMTPGACVKHCAVVSAVEPAGTRIVHAYWGRAVVETWLGPWWRRRVVGAWGFPASAAVAGRPSTSGLGVGH